MTEDNSIHLVEIAYKLEIFKNSGEFYREAYDFFIECRRLKQLEDSPEKDAVIFNFLFNAATNRDAYPDLTLDYLCAVKRIASVPDYFHSSKGLLDFFEAVYSGKFNSFFEEFMKGI